MAHVALVSILLVLFSFSVKTTTPTQAKCMPDQLHALIQLKQDFNTARLFSWNATFDCCIWEGITCDEQTGMVTALNLHERDISGVINPSLFNLSSLQQLDLSENYFDNITLPQTGFERLGNLTHLDLSHSGFAGQVPISISSLTNLISLDLSNYEIPQPFYQAFQKKENPNPLYLHDTGLKILLSNLTKLQVLRMDNVDISLNGSEWGNAIFQVGPTLQELSMADCGLRGNFPDEIFHLNLTKLDLSLNSMLSGPLDSIGNLQYLLELDLHGCNFYGEVPPSITNLTRLQELSLGSNRLTGAIPMSLFSHNSLEVFDLSNNQFSGYLPEFSNGSSILETIQFENNNLQGKLPISIFKSPQLTHIDLSSNNFNGTLNLNIIKHIEYIEYLDLSNNKLSIIEDKNHSVSFYASFPAIDALHLRSCKLTRFPSFLSYQNMDTLDLSNNSLTGEIPLSLCNTSMLTAVDLSHNNLTGTVPPCLLEDPSLNDLNLKSNKLSGPLPQQTSKPCGLKAINLNGNFINGSLPKLLMNCQALEVLDVGNNQIVNRFPYWLGNLEYLEVLVLRSNMFYGQISDVNFTTKENYSFFPMLKILDLSSNHFSGTLPKNFFVNLEAMMGVSNRSTPYLYYVRRNVASVSYKGLSFDLIDKIGIFSYLDLSNNGFWGRIPAEIGQLKTLVVLNIAHNALTCSIPMEFANLQQLQILDLSSNQLSGHIPQELTSLTFLSALNLSYNNLVGEIPEARQFSTFSNDSYLGNPGLCGSPLTMQCATAPPNHGIYKGLPSKFSADIIGLSVSIGLGLGVGFAAVIWATISWENGRKWFNFNIDRFYFRYFH